MRFLFYTDAHEVKPSTTHIATNPLLDSGLWFFAVNSITAHTLAYWWLTDIKQHFQCILPHRNCILVLQMTQSYSFDEGDGILQT